MRMTARSVSGVRADEMRIWPPPVRECDFNPAPRHAPRDCW